MKKADSTYLATEATCTEAAKYYYSCSCGEKGTETFTSGDALGHKYGDWTTTKEPTEIVKGERKKTCSVCGDVVTEEIPVLNHTTHTFTVKKVEPAYLASAATCTEPAKYYYVCTGCSEHGDETFDEGNALGHTEVVDEAVAATCTTAGKTEGKHCSVCNAVLVAQTEVPATDHAWGTVTYSWNDNNTQCTAKRVCGNDGTHIDEITTTNISHVTTTTADCQTKEVVTYTATFSGNWSVSKLPYEGGNATKPVTGSTNDDAHTYGTGWTGEEIGHWHVTTCGHTPTAAVAEKDATNSGYYEHTEDEKTTGCGICDYDPFVGIFEFTANGDEYTLSKYVGSATKVNIPATYRGKPVTAIGNNAFKFNTTITSVVIPGTITTIGGMAFYQCTALQDLTIEEGVTVIGDFAFQACSKLKSVTIPASVNSIVAAFYQCRAMESVIIKGNVTTIVGHTFQMCDKLESVVIPKSVTTIEEYAFSGSNAITEVYYAGTSDEWSGIAIESRNNGSLSTATVYYYSDTYVDGQNTWQYYNGKPMVNKKPTAESSFTTSDNSDGTVTITKYTGSDTDVVIPSTINGKKVTAIGDNAFYYNEKITSVVIPNGVTSIGADAFHGCRGLVSVIIPDGVISIGNNAFERCRGLVSVIIPDGVISIGNSAFNYCDALKSVTIPNSVTSIGANAFSDCSALTSITIPNSVNSIGRNAFSGCSGLTSITIEEGVTTIGMGQFSMCNNSNGIELILPKSIEKISNDAFYCAKTTIFYGGDAESWKLLANAKEYSAWTIINVYYYSETKPTDTTNKYWHYVNGVATAW